MPPTILVDQNEILHYVTDRMYYVIASAVAAVNTSAADAMEAEETSRTELDSHANMPVVGRNAVVLTNTGRYADVHAYNPDYQPMKLPIVDAAIRYDCPYTGVQCLMVIRNAIYVPALEHNLISPFILREAGIQVNDTPKIQVTDPDVSHHALYFAETDLRVPLSLWGVFSYFITKKPTNDDVEHLEIVYLLTPNQWNPHSDVYAHNERSMLDWEGNMVSQQRRRRIMLEEIPLDESLDAGMQISSVESNAIDECFQDDGLSTQEEAHVGDSLVEMLTEQAKLGQYSISIGATTAHRSEYLVEDDNPGEASDDESNTSAISLTASVITEVLKHDASGEIDIDKVMMSAAHARPRKDVTAEHLSKIWRIDLKAAQRTLDVTSQGSMRKENPSLSRNYATNDRMLRYKRISEYFFMDTFFATSKAGKSSRGDIIKFKWMTSKELFQPKFYVMPKILLSSAIPFFKICQSCQTQQFGHNSAVACTSNSATCLLYS